MTFGNIITQFPDPKHVTLDIKCFVFSVSQVVMYSCDISTNFGGHFVFEFFSRKKDKIELGMGQIWNQRTQIV